MSAESPDFPSILRLINKTNQCFQRRGWTPAFLQERIEVARKFATRSEYVEVVRYKDGTEETVGTLGLTYARIESTNENEIVPMEDPETFNWKIDRSKLRRGFIIELRTYGMEKAYNPEAFPNLFSGGIEVLHEWLKPYPELLDEPILYTYGDEVSIRLYRMMGFETVPFDELPPVFREQKIWHPLRTTPRRLFENHKQIKEAYKIWAETGTYQVQAFPGGPTLQADLSDGILFGIKSRILSLTLAEEAEIRPGLSVKKGGFVQWHDNGNLKLAGPLNSHTEIANGVFASENSRMFWYADGTPAAWINQGKYEVTPGNHVILDKKGDLKNLFLSPSRDVEVVSGAWASASSPVAWNNDHTQIYIGRLAKPISYFGQKWIPYDASVTLQLMPDGSWFIIDFKY